MEPQILFKDATVDSKGDIYVPALIADGDYFNENGICYTSELLEKWHNSNETAGLPHNAHPTGNHPLAYEDDPPEDLAESAKVEYYRKKSADWGFGKYVKSVLKTLENGSKRLIGIFKITDAGAKRAWREGKFPRFVSSSAYVHQKDETGRITDANLVGVSSVLKPAYPEHIAGISKQCTGGDECLSKLAESQSKRDHYCLYCRHTILTKISSLSNEKLSESSMENANPNSSESPEGTQNTNDSENKSPIKDLGQTHTSADGSNTEKISGEEEVDYKTLVESLQKELKLTKAELKTKAEAESKNTDTVNKLVKESLASKIRERLAKVPLFAFDNKEENKEEVVKEFLALHPRLKEEEILTQVERRFKLAPLIVEAHKKQQEGSLKESGLITDEGKLIIHDEQDSNDVGYSIRDATEVFG